MKRKLNGDGHKFYQYLQNKQSPIILTELPEHKKDHNIWRCKSRSCTDYTITSIKIILFHISSKCDFFIDV